MYAPGWYPDPLGRHEYRYHNGSEWTRDVASGGQRFVDPLTAPAPATPKQGGNGLAIASLTCGIVSIGLGWIPVVFAVGAVLAVLALVFGVTGLSRARRVQHGRGFAIAGLITGGVGLLVAAAGLVLTVIVFRAVERYENPAPHDAAPPACTVNDGRVEGIGEIRNLDTEPADFSVVIEIRRSGSGIALDTVRVRVDDVPAGQIEVYQFARRTTASDITCEVTAVKGPLPFGIVID